MHPRQSANIHLYGQWRIDPPGKDAAAATRRLDVMLPTAYKTEQQRMTDVGVVISRITAGKSIASFTTAHQRDG